VNRNYQVVKGNDESDLERQISYKRENGWKCQGGICVTDISDVAGQFCDGEEITTDTDLIYYQAMVKGYI